MKAVTRKVWFVTGASKGIGLALTKYLLANGHQVAATSRDTASIFSQFPDCDNLLALKVDLSSDKEVKSAIDATIKRFGSIDVAVNNAGYGLVGALEELTDAEFRQTFDIDLFGTVNVIRASLPFFRKQGRGHIINISSIAGYAASAYSGSYDAAKVAVIGLSESLRSEVKDFGVNVTVVIPGLFRTNFMNESSLQITQNTIGAYRSLNQMRQWQQYSGHQPGNPEQLAMALADITEMDNPPMHLLLGTDAYQLATAKMKANLEAFEQWRGVTESMGF